MNLNSSQFPVYIGLIIRMSGRRLTEIKGALIFAEKWELDLQTKGKLKAVVKIDLLRYFGNEEEPTIGDPRDFNTYRIVTDLFNDPNRRSLLLLPNIL
jgi:hypothetical protein